MGKKNQHVVPYSSGWAVKGAGNAKATAVFRAQKEAIVRATQIARNGKAGTKIHGRDGKFVRVTAMGVTRVRLGTRSESFHLTVGVC